eukprot:TRINITY_DN33024_c0_g1_i1.p2 TRINITY_DN33024_c0_g1~~TRINITY_DN33024_c0_g1_i1.p2  ORF type:complete len:109 (-),score=8.13 TRINITY_DN33024_c0_g1_i1:185-466(-)
MLRAGTSILLWLTCCMAVASYRVVYRPAWHKLNWDNWELAVVYSIAAAGPPSLYLGRLVVLRETTWQPLAFFGSDSGPLAFLDPNRAGPGFIG